MLDGDVGWVGTYDGRMGVPNEGMCHEHNSSQSPNVLVGPGVENRVQLAAIDCHSVACVLEGRKCEVTREGPTGPRVSTKSGVSGVFPEWFQEVWSSGELRSYNRVREVRKSES